MLFDNQFFNLSPKSNSNISNEIEESLQLNCLNKHSLYANFQQSKELFNKNFQLISKNQSINNNLAQSYQNNKNNIKQLTPILNKRDSDINDNILQFEMSLIQNSSSTESNIIFSPSNAKGNNNSNNNQRFQQFNQMFLKQQINHKEEENVQYQQQQMYQQQLNGSLILENNLQKQFQEEEDEDIFFSSQNQQDSTAKLISNNIFQYSEFDKNESQSKYQMKQDYQFYKNTLEIKDISSNTQTNKYNTNQINEYGNKVCSNNQYRSGIDGDLFGENNTQQSSTDLRINCCSKFKLKSDKKLNTSHVPNNMLNLLTKYLIPIFQDKIPCRYQPQKKFKTHPQFLKYNKCDCNRCSELRLILQIKYEKKNLTMFKKLVKQSYRLEVLVEDFLINKVCSILLDRKDSYRSTDTFNAMYYTLDAFVNGVRAPDDFNRIL